MAQWLCVSTGIVVGDWFYFTILNGNGLFRWNAEKECIEYLGKFPNEEVNQNSMFDKISIYENYLIFWPFQAKKVGVYDLDNQRFVSTVCNNIKFNNIENMVVHKGEYYFFGGCNEPYIYKYNADFRYGNYIIQNMNNIIENQNECQILTHELDYDDKNLYIPVSNIDCILSFHWGSKKIEKIELPKIGANYCQIICVNEMIYMLDTAGRLVCYNKDAKKLSVLFDMKDCDWDWDDGGIAYGKILRYQDCICLIPYGRNCEFVCYNFKTKQVYFGGDGLPKGYNGGERYAEIHGKMLYIFDNAKGALMRIDLDNYDSVEVDCRDIFNIGNFYNMNGGCIYERGFICNSLQTYISDIEQYTTKQIKSQEIGTEIYRNLAE